MTPGEIGKIAEIAQKVGIKKLKLTGGEPLLRKDIIEIVKRTSEYMQEVSMTTNGVLLEGYARSLKDAGLSRVNVSFDGFDHKTFFRITGKNLFNEVKNGVIKAVDVGLNPVKLNMVVLKGINEKEISRGVELASDIGAILQLIEFETRKEEAQNYEYKKYHFHLDKVEKLLAESAREVRHRNMHRRRKYILPSENNGKTEVEVVRGMHNSEFCANCTRIRVTSSGELKPCLLRNDNNINIIGPIRNGAKNNELIALFERAIFLKEPYWRS
jgi:cyclic pyranopterin phosphate synthase